MDDALALYRTTSEADDIDGLMGTLAPNVELVSPISGRMVFRGRDDVRVLLSAVYAILTDLRWREEVGDTSVLVARKTTPASSFPTDRAGGGPHSPRGPTPGRRSKRSEAQGSAGRMLSRPRPSGATSRLSRCTPRCATTPTTARRSRPGSCSTGRRPSAIGSPGSGRRQRSLEAPARRDYPSAIAEQLRARGHDVVAVTTRAELRSLSDEGVFAAAQEERRAIVTENIGDFSSIADAADHRGHAQQGLVLTDPAKCPRGNPRTIGLMVTQLDRLLNGRKRREPTSLRHWL